MSSKLAKDQGKVPYQELLDKNRALEVEVQDLKIRLEEAEELRRAISEGDLDALVIPGPQEKLIFTLESADRAYRVLVETMNEGTVTLASDGTILYCNRRFAELIKMRSQAIVGTSIYGFIESEDEHTFNALLNQSTNAGEIKLRAKNGISVPVYLSISSLHSEGSQSAWCLVATDLTEQKKNEEIVSAGRLAQSIIEQAAEAIVVCDTDGKVIHFSKVVSGICKCNPALQKFEEIIDVQFSEGAKTGESVLPVSSALRGFSILGVETILELKDGKKFHLLLNSGPLKNSDGGIIGCVLTLTDITERKLAEKALLESEKRFKLLSEANSTLLLSKEPENMIQAIAGKVMRHLNCDVFFNYVLDDEQSRLHLNAYGGISEEAAKEIEWLDKGSAICGCVARNGYRIVSEDVQHNEDKRANLVRSMGIQAYACQPLNIGETTIGTLSFGASSRKDFKEDELALMSTVADQASAAIERKRAEDKLKETLDNLENIVKDRTAELEKAYDSLKESERGLAEAQKMAHLGSWYRSFMTDKVYWSDETYRIFGFKPQEFEITFDAFLNYVNPEDRKCMYNNIKKALKGEPFSSDYRIISANGTERIVHTQGEIVFDEKKTPIGMKGTIQDITEQKLAMEKIKESEERTQLYLQNFKGIGTQLDGNFVPVFLHGAVEELTGYTKEDFLSGKIRWSEIVVPEDLAGLQEKAQKMKNIPNLTVRHEYRISKKDGEIRWIHGTVQNISEPGNKELYQGMMYDITDRKIAEEALEKMDRIRIKEIHHRIKNNLQVICSLLSLEAEKFSDEKMLEALKESQNRVASMALIHEELYKGNKSDTLDFASYLHKFTKDLFSSYNLGDSNISLKTDLEQVYLDMDAAVPLGIIVNELVSNSLKHAFPAGSEGEIQISLLRTGTFDEGYYISGSDQDCREKGNFQYVLRVRDNGKGIPEEIEIENADSLGLQLINILVAQINGCVELRRNCGTEFAIWFGNKEP